MKRIITIILSLVLVLCLICIMTGCGNRQFFDTTYTFETAIIMLPNGEIIEGKVESWGDYADGDQIQVKIDGKTYLVHSSNTCLIAG